MSSGVFCRAPGQHRGSWMVRTRKANYSAFNGYHYTPSDYSEVICPACPGRWRTKANYVDDLPDEPQYSRHG